MFNKYFNFAVPSALAKYFYETKDKKKNNKLVNVTNTGLNDLKNEIKKKFWKWKINRTTIQSIKNCQRDYWF